MKHYCIDRILPKNMMRFNRTAEQIAGAPLFAIAQIGRSWINGSTLSVKFIGGADTQRAIAKEQFGWWSAHANIKFDFNQSPQADIRISFNQDDGAWSYIGTDCKSIPSDQPTMNLGFLDGGTAAHEAGHALSLAHEHSNPAGGIQWNQEVVLKDLGGAPNYWDEATVWHNVFEKYAANQINGTEFDPASIMLYAFPAEWTLNNIATKSNDVLSALDKSFIASEKMYPKDAPTATPLLVDAPLRTKADIGAFGEEDVFVFNILTPGRYLIDTLGWTDVVMKLFGPNSETAVIAEDDDSGTFLNASIKIDLADGQYFVQVRHYNKENGKGFYSIRVATV